jgi:hypothetical protein
MKRLLIAVFYLALIAPFGVAFAFPSSVDRVTNYIAPLIKTDHIRAEFFTATSSATTATSTFPRVTIGTALTLFGTFANSLDDLCVGITGGSGLCDGTDDNTTYTAGDHLTLTGTDFDVDDDFLLNTGDTGTGLYVLSNASTTLLSTGYASSTIWRGGGLDTDCDTAATSKLLWDITTGQFSCGTDQGGTAYDAWTHPAFGESATTSLMIFTNGFLSNASSSITRLSSVLSTSTSATSTNLFSTNAVFTRATTTSLYVTNPPVFSTLTSALLLTGSGGLLAEYAGTSCTNQAITAFSALGAATCTSITNEFFGNDDWGDITVSGTTASVEDDSHAHTASTISGLGTADISGLDISDDTNLAAGRSLTLSGDSVEADSELYTYGIAANLFATTTSGISTTTENFLAIRVPIASTITGFNCYADDTGTSTIRATVASNPLSAGTDILYSTGVRCGAQVYTSTTTFGTTAVAAGSVIRIYVSDASPTGSRPRVVYPNFVLTKDD